MALSDTSKPGTKISLESKLISPGLAGSPLPLTKVVKLQSSPVKLSPAGSPGGGGGGGGSNKPIRVIKLTPAQAEAFKKSRAAGQVMFSKEKLLSPLSASIVNGAGHLSKENTTDQYLNKNILTQSELEPPSKKMMRLDTEKPPRPNKEELQSKLELELARKAEEADRLREETRLRDLECEKLKQQLKALSS